MVVTKVLKLDEHEGACFLELVNSCVLYLSPSVEKAVIGEVEKLINEAYKLGLENGYGMKLDDGGNAQMNKELQKIRDWKDGVPTQPTRKFTSDEVRNFVCKECGRTGGMPSVKNKGCCTACSIYMGAPVIHADGSEKKGEK
jgi:hypothetical protein